MRRAGILPASDGGFQSRIVAQVSKPAVSPRVSGCCEGHMRFYSMFMRFELMLRGVTDLKWTRFPK
ncbi:MAG TPA: hypothetical protein VNV43_07585, partial [Candidatus Acidoferrales bacterium]|nr:hypothetical protein [Candidatus Acidoferrales bacterium]